MNERCIVPTFIIESTLISVTVADPRGGGARFMPPNGQVRSLFHAIIQGLWLQSKQLFINYNFFKIIFKTYKTRLVMFLACQQRRPPYKIVLERSPKPILSVTNSGGPPLQPQPPNRREFFEGWEDPHVASFNDGWGITGGTCSAGSSSWHNSIHCIVD